MKRKIRSSKWIAGTAALVITSLILLISVAEGPIMDFSFIYEEHVFDCSNAAAFVFQMCKLDGRNVTIEHGCPVPSNNTEQDYYCHAWVEENGSLFFGSDEKSIRESFIFQRKTFYSVEEAEAHIPGEWDISKANLYLQISG